MENETKQNIKNIDIGSSKKVNNIKKAKKMFFVLSIILIIIIIQFNLNLLFLLLPLFIISLTYASRFNPRYNKFIFIGFVILMIIGAVVSYNFKSDFDKHCSKGVSEDENIDAERIFTCSYYLKDLKGRAKWDDNLGQIRVDTVAKEKIIAHCKAMGYNYANISTFEPTSGVCYKFTDGNKTCIDNSQCQSGYCTPSDDNCKENCTGRCETWEGNRPYNYITGCSYSYLSNGKYYRGGPCVVQ